jgi:PilZ domain-containing protein
MDADQDERRREPRLPCEGEARIIDTASRLELGEGIITDISPSGAAVYVYCPLIAGTIIELQQGEIVYHGEIRYCVPSGPDFRLGIQLIPREQWSPDKSWPKLRVDSP